MAQAKQIGIPGAFARTVFAAVLVAAVAAVAAISADTPAAFAAEPAEVQGPALQTAAQDDENLWADSQGPDPQAITVADFASGSGTAEDPYVIATPEQLVSFRNTVNKGNTYAGQHIALGADIDMGAYNWVPIGASIRSGSGIRGTSTPFCGTFDGAGHTIGNLTLKAANPLNADYAIGLFGGLKGATVKNLTIADADIQATGSELAGILCGVMVDDSTVSNVNVGGKLSAVCGSGGIAGRMTLSGTIENCANGASIATTGASGNTGGIVGAAYYTTPDGAMRITGCSNSGAISGTNDTGGIVGLCCGFVDGCTNTGAVTGNGYSTGGIAGELKNYGGVNGSSNSGDVSTTKAGTGVYGTGGIVGWARFDGVAPSYAQSARLAVTNNDNSGKVSGQNDAGGIVGVAYSAVDVTGNQNTAPSLDASVFAAGIVGSIQKQDGPGLPAGIAEGVTVANNVSTTPIDAIAAPSKDLYVYDNHAVPATIENQATKWAATVGGQRYTTLQQALDEAPDGGTVKLASTAEAVPVVNVDRAGSVTLDLNGHDVAFLPEGEFLVTAGDFVITGEGSVYKPEDAPNQTLVKVGPQRAGAQADARIEGGSFSADVARFADGGYSEFVRDQASPIGKYLVLPTDEAKSRAKASVTSHGVTVYFEKAADAHDAAAQEPGSVVTELDGQAGPGGEGDAGGESGEPVVKPFPIEPEQASEAEPTIGAVGAPLNQVGDDAGPWAALLAAVSAAALLAMGLAARASFRRM